MMKRIAVKRISLESHGIFLVEMLLDEVDPIVFKFEVEEGDIDVVKSPGEFISLIERNIRPFQPLLNCLLSLHRAYKLPLTIGAS